MLGAFESEFNEDNKEDLRNLGSWDASTHQEKHYMTKLLMPLHHQKEGWIGKGGCNELQSSGFFSCSSIFPWVPKARQPFESGSAANVELATKHKTARMFLAMMDLLHNVIIQDASAMKIACPDCANHGLFKLPLFHTPAFFKLTTDLKAYLEFCKGPYDNCVIRFFQVSTRDH